jgi:DUF4097 and DUF4098 domain-containing protein YvlB
VVARVPLDGRISLKLASADAELLGRWRDATANSASGDLKVDEITGDLSANLASGDLQATRIGGDVKATSASGDIKVRSIGGDASLNTASGDVRVEDAGGSVTARSASGDLDLGQVRRGEVRVQTASGDVRVAVVPGTGVYLDVSTVSGDTRSDLAVGDAPPAGQGADVSVHARTVSGDVSIVRAAQKASA